VVFWLVQLRNSLLHTVTVKRVSMPKNGKRKNKARSGLRKNASAIRGGDPLPPRLAACLRYGDQQLLTASASYTGYTYRGNSWFDPDQTGTGSQPNFFDQLAAMYQKYRIVRFHYEVSVSCRTGSGGQVTVVNTNATTFSTWGSSNAASGYPGAKTQSFGGAGSQPCVIKGTVEVGEVYGVPTSTIMADPNFVALVSANIGNSVYMAVCIDTAGATDTVQLGVVLYMEGWFETRAYEGLSLVRRKRVEEVPVVLPQSSVSTRLEASCGASTPEAPACAGVAHVCGGCLARK